MRSLPPELRDAIFNRDRIIVMAAIDAPSGISRMWSGIGTLSYGGYDWYGVGLLGKITGIGGAKNLAVHTVTFELRGVPLESRPYLELNLRNRPAQAWIAALKPRRLEVDGDPYLAVDGKCDQPTLSIGQDGSATVKLIVSEPIFQLERALDLAWTSEWIKATYGDTISGLDMIPELVNANVSWTQS